MEDNDKISEINNDYNTCIALFDIAATIYKY